MNHCVKLLAFPAIVTLAAISASCINPTPNSGYFAMDPAQAEDNRQNTHRIEQEGRDMDHIERMRRAEANELSTRHAPRSVSTTTVVAPRLWGWGW